MVFENTTAPMEFRFESPCAWIVFPERGTAGVHPLFVEPKWTFKGGRPLAAKSDEPVALPRPTSTVSRLQPLP